MIRYSKYNRIGSCRNITAAGEIIRQSMLHSRLPGILRPSIILMIICLIISAGATGQPMDIDNRRQLFVDYKFIRDTRNVELRVHQPRKTGEISIPSEPHRAIGGYHCVVEKDGTHHLWYTAASSIA